jgi:hypothetical protein
MTTLTEMSPQAPIRILIADDEAQIRDPESGS